MRDVYIPTPFESGYISCVSASSDWKCQVGAMWAAYYRVVGLGAVEDVEGSGIGSTGLAGSLHIDDVGSSSGLSCGGRCCGGVGLSGFRGISCGYGKFEDNVAERRGVSKVLDGVSESVDGYGDCVSQDSQDGRVDSDGGDRTRRERFDVVSAGLTSGPVPVVVRGKHWKKNQKKQKKKNGVKGVDSSDWRRKEVEEKTVLQLSLEEKWAAENALKTAKAKRELELLGQQSVEEVAKLQQKKLQAALDKTMVQIEKSHATLASTGNVPGFVPEGGYCKTVVSGESVPVLSEGCTISPDSSASMHEYNLAMKKVAELELEVTQLKRGAKFDKYRYTGAVTLTCDSGGNLSDACEEDLKKNLRVGWMEASRETYVDEGAEDSTGKAMGVRVEQVPNMSYMPMRHFN